MLKRMKLGKKLVGAFLSVSVVAAIIGMFGIMNLRSINTAYTQLLDNTAGPLTALSREFSTRA